MNDFIQGIIMLFGIVAVILAVLQINGGFMASMAELSKIKSDVFDMEGAFTSFVGPMPLYLLVVVLLTSLGTWGLPQMVSRFYAIRNEKSIKKGTIISTLFAIVVAGGCYFLGGFGRLFETQENVDANGFDSIVPSMLSNLPDILIAVVLILVLSASMSTLSSLVLASSSTITLDFIEPMTKTRDMGESKRMIMIRFFVALFIVISAVIAIVQARSHVTFIAQLMGISWGALAGAFLAPFLYGLYWKKASRAACATGFAFGTITMIVQLLISLGVMLPHGAFMEFVFQNSLFSGVFAMLVSLLLIPAVSLLTQKSVPEETDDMFACYETKMEVTVRTSLPESGETEID